VFISGRKGEKKKEGGGKKKPTKLGEGMK